MLVKIIIKLFYDMKIYIQPFLLQKINIYLFY